MRVEFSELLGAVNRVKATVAPDKHGVEAYTWLCFNDKRLTSFDGANATITNSGLSGVSFCVHAKKFSLMCSTLKGRTGSFEHKDDWLYVEAGSYKTKMPTFDVLDFPDLMPGKTEVYCQATDIVEAFRRVAVTTSKSDSQPNLCGVGMRGRYLYSTDGKRLSRAMLNAEVGGPAIIPEQAMRQMVRLGQPDFLFSSGNDVGALYKDTKTMVLSRQLSGSFPFDAIDDALNGGAQGNCVFGVPNELREVIERVRVLVDDEESQILLDCDGSELTVATKGTETGQTEETLPFMCGSKFSCKVSSKGLWEMLKGLDPQQIDLTDVLCGDARMLLFYGEGFESATALMS